MTKKILASGEKQVLILVIKKVETNAEQRARIAKAHESLSTSQMRAFSASFIVAENAMIRGAMTAISWLIGNKWGPLIAVKTYDEALAQALETVRRLKLALPRDLDGLRIELGLAAPPGSGTAAAR